MENPTTKLRLSLAVSLALFAAPQTLFAAQDENAQWRAETTSDGTSSSPRHETGSVVVGGNLYVLGGRRSPPVEVYKPSTDGWQNLGAAPTDLHHFQPVAVGSDIYIIGAMTCCFPNEPSVAEIHVFNTANSNWSIAGQMPANRLRGGGGTVVYNNKIYVVGGNTQGHSGGAVSWFDEYNPATGAWSTLPNAPTARDHFQAVVVGNELVVTGGRQTNFPNPFANTVAETNIYNFATGQWRVGAPIPTQRAGSPTVGVGNEVIVLGGEAAGQSTAFDTVEAYDVDLNVWRTLQPMREGRHSGASGILGNRLHMVAGSAGIGGAPEITSHESLLLRDVMVTEPEDPVDEGPAQEPDEQPPEQPPEEPTEQEPATDEPEDETVTDEPVVEEPEEEAGGDEPVVDEPGDESGGEEPAVDEPEDETANESVDEETVITVIESEDTQPTEQEATGDLGDIGSTDEAREGSASSGGGGSSFGAASWPIIGLIGGLLGIRRRNSSLPKI